MLIRVISAVIGAPLVLGLTYLGGKYTAFLVGVLALLALREFLQIGEHMGVKAWYVLTTGAALTWLVLVFRGGQEWMALFLVLWLLVSLGRVALQYPKIQWQEAGYNFLAVVYSVVFLSYLYLLRTLPNGLTWTLLVFFLVWSTDTGAYLVGRTFGRHPLAPQVSPKKTVEGSLGGLLFSMAVGWVFWRSAGGASWEFYLGLALLIGISGQIGDLFESAIKRSAGVKDSGRLIPGHGGILDRFDSFVFAAPLVYYGIVIWMV